MIRLAMILAQVSPTPAPTPIDPASWVRSEDYPAEALKNGDSGTVQFSVLVDEEGRPHDCSIVASSGHESLDSVTCRLVIANGRFKPASLAGKAVSAIYKGKMTWAGVGPSGARWQAIIVDFDASGGVVCKEESDGWMGKDARRSCGHFLENTELIRELSGRFSRVVALLAIADKREELYRGHPTWGGMLSLLGSQQFYLRGAYPVSCATIVAEGGAANHDACEGMPNNRALNAQELKEARSTFTHTVTFGVPRAPSR